MVSAEEMKVASVDLVNNTSSATIILQSLEANEEGRVDGYVEMSESEMLPMSPSVDEAAAALAQRVQEMKIETPPQVEKEVFVRKTNNSVYNPAARSRSSENFAKRNRGAPGGLSGAKSDSKLVGKGIRRSVTGGGMVGSKSEGRGKRWSMWEGSHVEVHEQKMEERKFRKRTTLIETLRQKERDECSFTPRISKASNRMSQSPRRIPAYCADAVLNRKAQIHENLKHEVSSEQCTFQPAISKFARDAVFEDETKNVFDRLAVPKTVHTPVVTAQINLFDSSPVTTPRRARSSDAHVGQRGIMLYNDALERRGRHQKRVASHDAASKRSFSPSASSDSYWWKYLEKRVITAFRDAVPEGDSMCFMDFGHFLIAMGVNLDEDQFHAPIDEDIPKSALWRHLDSMSTGQVDLLTLRVFFFTMWGPVDPKLVDCFHDIGASRVENLMSASTSPCTTRHFRGSLSPARTNDTTSQAQGRELEKEHSPEVSPGQDCSHWAHMDGFNAYLLN